MGGGNREYNLPAGKGVQSGVKIFHPLPMVFWIKVKFIQMDRAQSSECRLCNLSSEEECCVAGTGISWIREIFQLSLVFLYPRLLLSDSYPQASVDHLSRTSLFSELSDLSVTDIDDSDHHKVVEATGPRTVS